MDRVSPNSRRMLRVDAHCHIFNGEDIDGLGYVFQFADPATAHSAFIKPFAYLAKELIALIKWRAPGQHSESRLLDNLLDRRAERIKHGQRPATRETLLAQLENDIVELNNLSWRQSHAFRRGTPSPHDEVTRQVEAALRDSRSDAGAALQAVNAELSKPGAIERVRAWRGHPLAWLLHPLMKLKVEAPLQDWLGGFLTGFVAHRIGNAVHMMRRYPDVHLFIAATLDVDLWFRGGFHGSIDNPSEPIAAQAEMAGKIAVLSEGHIIPRTGFDPLRHAYWRLQRARIRTGMLPPNTPLGEAPVETLKRACELWGSAGVKFYPVVGFRVWKNMGFSEKDRLRNNQYPRLVRAIMSEVGTDLNNGHHDISKHLDTSLRQLYYACNDGHYTVMAHTTPSHGPDDETESRTAPDYFFAAAEEFPRVGFDLGHFGGIGDSQVDFADPRPMKKNKPADWFRWPEQIARYFSDSAANLYADLAYVDPAAHSVPVKNLGHFFERYPASRRKILYGSDWHEVLTSASSYGYCRRWSRLLENDHRFRRHAEGVLGQNAADFLGLRAGQKTRHRLERFFDQWKIETPEWMRLVDAGRTS